MAGLILYGAGFHPLITPSQSFRPAVYAAAGADDFNLPEVVRLGESLRKAGAAHGGETYSGGHDWGPSEVCRRAVAWMEAQAMKAGRRGRSENLLYELWAVVEGHARALEKSGDLAGAFAAYGTAALTFEGLLDTSGARREAARLGALKAVRSARQEESELFRRQAELYARLDAHAREWAGGENRVAAAAEFRREVAALRGDARRAEDVGARRLARRVLDALFIQFVEAARSHGRLRRDYRAALSQLAMADTVAPDAPVVAYETARLHALLGEKGKAAEWLLKALDRRPDDAARLCNDPALNPLCDSPAVRDRLVGQPRPTPPPGNN